MPKTILALMNVEGLTRENVASHLQKYRAYVRRISGLPPGAHLPHASLAQVPLSLAPVRFFIPSPQHGEAIMASSVHVSLFGHSSDALDEIVLLVG